MTIYTVIIEDRENLLVHSDTFRTLEEAWQDIVANAKETYDIDDFNSYDKRYMLLENNYLYLNEENVYYEIHVNSI